MFFRKRDHRFSSSQALSDLSPQKLFVVGASGGFEVQLIIEIGEFSFVLEEFCDFCFILPKKLTEARLIDRAR